MERTEVKDSMSEEGVLKLLVEISSEKYIPKQFKRKKGKPAENLCVVLWGKRKLVSVWTPC